MARVNNEEIHRPVHCSVLVCIVVVNNMTINFILVVVLVCSVAPGPGRLRLQHVNVLVAATWQVPRS